RERRIATFVVAEILAVEPDVGDVTHGAEFEDCVPVAPHRGRQEIKPVEPAGSRAVRRRVEGAGDRDRRPGGIVIEDAAALAQLLGYRLQRALAVLQAEVGVDRLGVEAPLAAQLGPQARLAVKRRYGLPGLERHSPARLVLEGERGREVRAASAQDQA